MQILSIRCETAEINDSDANTAVFCICNDANRNTRSVALEKQERNLTNMKTKGMMLLSVCFRCLVCVAEKLHFSSSLLL